jgi:hypothetical protein
MAWRRTTGLEHDGGFDFVVDALQLGGVTLESNGVDAAIRADPSGKVFQRSEHLDVVFRIVHSDCANGTRHGEALRNTINCDDPCCAQHEGAGHCELAHRSCTPHSNRIARKNLSVFRGHVARRKYVRKEKHFFVGQIRFEF